MLIRTAMLATVLLGIFVAVPAVADCDQSVRGYASVSKDDAHRCVLVLSADGSTLTHSIDEDRITDAVYCDLLAANAAGLDELLLRLAYEWDWEDATFLRARRALSDHGTPNPPVPSDVRSACNLGDGVLAVEVSDQGIVEALAARGRSEDEEGEEQERVSCSNPEDLNSCDKVRCGTASPKETFECYRAGTSNAGIDGSPRGTSHVGGTADIVSDLMQALGQIVVDRASQVAFDSVVSILRRNLSCEDDHMGAPDLAHTCRALDGLSLSNLVADAELLGAAVLMDTVAQAAEYIVRADGPTDDVKVLTDVLKALTDVLILNLDSIAGGDYTYSLGEITVQTLLEMAEGWLDTQDGLSNDRLEFGARVIVLASSGFLQCRLSPNSRRCSPAERVRRMAQSTTPDPEFLSEISRTELALAQHLATELRRALPRTVAPDDLREVSLRAIDLWSTTACLLTSIIHSDATKADFRIEQFSCVDPSRYLTELTELYDANGDDEVRADIRALKGDEVRALIGGVQAITRAAIREDYSRLVDDAAATLLILWSSSGSGACEQGGDSNKCARHQARFQDAVLLLDGIIQLSATYIETRDDDGDTEAIQETRQEILNSMIDEFTHRSHRRGDHIFSLGGSLQLGASRRLTKEDSDSGDWRQPWSLPIGFAWDFISKRSEVPGFHLEVGIVDLGEYLAFDDATGEVAEFDAAAVFAPTATIGAAWGTQARFFIGVQGGYSPQYEFEEDDDGKPVVGAWHVGGTVGIHIPFFDFN